MDKVLIEVRDGGRSFLYLTTVRLTPRQHKGWQSVRHNAYRYQVFGGIRGPLFIDISNPIRGVKQGG